MGDLWTFKRTGDGYTVTDSLTGAQFSLHQTDDGRWVATGWGHATVPTYTRQAACWLMSAWRDAIRTGLGANL
jgi:hypothetical protein